MRRVDSVDRAGSPFKNEPTRQNQPSRFQLKLCNSEAVSTELTIDCRAGLKVM